MILLVFLLLKAFVCLFLVIQFLIRVFKAQNNQQPIKTITSGVITTQPTIETDKKESHLLNYQSSNITKTFYFERLEEAPIFEEAIKSIQRWIFYNKVDAISCLKEIRIDFFFGRQKIQTFAKRMLIELFSIHRDTRLKALLSYLSSEQYSEDAKSIATAFALLIVATFDIPINDSHAFQDTVTILTSSFCASYNLFICDFMLHSLIGGALANEIIQKHNLNDLLCINKRRDQSHIDKFFEQEFLKPIVGSQNPGFIKQFFGASVGEKELLLSMLKNYANRVLKDMYSFQEILSDLPKHTVLETIDYNSNLIEPHTINEDSEFSAPIQVEYGHRQGTMTVSQSADLENCYEPYNEYVISTIHEESRCQEIAPMIFHPQAGEIIMFDQYSQPRFSSSHIEFNKNGNSASSPITAPYGLSGDTLKSDTAASTHNANQMDTSSANSDISRVSELNVEPIVYPSKHFDDQIRYDRKHGIPSPNIASYTFSGETSSRLDPATLTTNVNQVDITSDARSNMSRVSELDTEPIDYNFKPDFKLDSEYDINQVLEESYMIEPKETQCDLGLGKSTATNSAKSAQARLIAPVNCNQEYTRKQDEIVANSSSIVVPTLNIGQFISTGAIKSDTVDTYQAFYSYFADCHQTNLNNSSNTDGSLPIDIIEPNTTGSIQTNSVANADQIKTRLNDRVPATSFNTAAPISNTDRIILTGNTVQFNDEANVYYSPVRVPYDTASNYSSTDDYMNQEYVRQRIRNTTLISEFNEEEYKEEEKGGGNASIFSSVEERKGCQQLVFGISKTKYAQVIEKRKKMAEIKKTFKELTSDESVISFNKMHKHISSGLALPEATKVLQEVQNTYNTMIDQYLKYHQRFEECELEYDLLCSIEFIHSYKTVTEEMFQELHKRKTVSPSLFDKIYSFICEGIEIATSLDHTWKTYMKCSSSFKNTEKTRQIVMANILLDFNLLLEEYETIFDVCFGKG